jgi:hypothetical protein
MCNKITLIYPSAFVGLFKIVIVSLLSYQVIAKVVKNAASSQNYSIFLTKLKGFIE